MIFTILLPLFFYLLTVLIEIIIPWKVYSNSENGFTLKVPAVLTVNNEYSDKYRIGWIGKKIRFSGNFNEAQIQYFPYNHPDLISIAGMKAFKSKSVPRTMGMSPSEEVLTYDFAHNNKRIAFSLHSIPMSEYRNSPFGSYWRLNPYEVYIFEKMLESLVIH